MDIFYTLQYFTINNKNMQILYVPNLVQNYVILKLFYVIVYLPTLLDDYI